MSERPMVLRSRRRRRPFRFWALTWYAAMWPFCHSVGSILFQIFWWTQYGVWLPEPTSECFDGKAFYHPDTPWVVAHPLLKFVFPIPLSITSAVLGLAIIGVMMLVDDRFGSGRRARKIKFRLPEDV